MTDEPTVVVVRDPDSVADAAARHIAASLRAAVEARGRAHWATTGGSMAASIYQRLAAPPVRDAIPWDRVHTWWGDDRFARRGEPMSNVTAADTFLIGPLGLDPALIHPIPIDDAADPTAAAARYTDELRAAGLAERDGLPVLDLVLLGIGPDGHVLSVFPDSSAWDDATSPVLPIPAPSHIEPRVERVTMNPRIVLVAREVLVIAAGSAKANALGRVFAASRDTREVPGRVARRAGATWLLDEAAAADLPPHVRAP